MSVTKIQGNWTRKTGQSVQDRLWFRHLHMVLTGPFPWDIPTIIQLRVLKLHLSPRATLIPHRPNPWSAVHLYPRQLSLIPNLLKVCRPIPPHPKGLYPSPRDVNMPVRGGPLQGLLLCTKTEEWSFCLTLCPVVWFTITGLCIPDPHRLGTQCCSIKRGTPSAAHVF